MRPGISIGESIRIQNALMAELITACLGDKAKAIRLLEYERRRNPRLKTMEAIDIALGRLCHDRGGISRPAAFAGNANGKSAWTNSVSFASGERKQGPPDVNGRMALSVFLACAVVVGFTKMASSSLEPQVQAPPQLEVPTPHVPESPPTASRPPAPRLPAPQAYANESRDSSGIFKCTVNGRTVYADSPCGTPATTKRVALQDSSAGFASPPRERLEDLTARRVASEQAYERSMQAQATQVRVDNKKAECEDLSKHIERLDSAARAPQWGQTQDWFRAEKTRAQSRQFDLRC